MSQIDELRKQNQSLIKTLVRLGFQLRLGGHHNGAALHRELSEIAQKIDQHLHEEEAAVYPALDHSKHDLIRRISRASHRDLEQLDRRVSSFVQRWPNGPSIDAEHDTFKHEAAQLVDAIRRMLTDEMSNLFPIAEGAHA